ncbi:MAG: glycosyltransferase, partial [Methanobacterium sp.]|nr:glycosyltransferase [Methanobacterium sp.]
METPKVTIVIVNWNGWEDTIECLKSLYHVNYTNFNIIIVDNHSQDDSVKKIKDYIENKKLILIVNDENYGFAEGNNIGIRYAQKNFNPDYILLLNNDTIVDKEFL